MGLTPTLVSGVWVGGDDRDIHFDSMALGQGASMALPVFALYLQKVYKDTSLGYSPDAVFDLPEGFNPCTASSDELAPDGTSSDGSPGQEPMEEVIE